MLTLLTALNHVRTGFAHRDPKKTERIPPEGEGILWVAPSTGSEWTVQKPHAFSSIRFCESVFRYVILCCWGRDAAIKMRSQLPQVLDDQLPRSSHDKPLDVGEKLLSELKIPNLREALKLTRHLRESVLAEHFGGSASTQLSLPLGISESDRFLPLFDPIASPSQRERSTLDVAAGATDQLPLSSVTVTP